MLGGSAEALAKSCKGYDGFRSAVSQGKKYRGCKPAELHLLFLRRLNVLFAFFPTRYVSDHSNSSISLSVYMVTLAILSEEWCLSRYGTSRISTSSRWLRAQRSCMAV